MLRFDGISHMALRMRGADVDCSRISIRAVRSHKPSRKATVGSVAPSHLAPCLTRWRREGWHRLRNPLDNLGVFPRILLGLEFLQHRQGVLKLLIGHRLNPAGMLDLQFARHQKRTDFHINRRVLLPHPRNGFRAALSEILCQRFEECLVD
jgi:hypothetical protein